MTKGRLEAFSDGVIAILITIMVLELKVPQGADWAAFRTAFPTLFVYVLSFLNIAIYWNNHHHMLHVTDHVNGATLWANMHLLFWLSLIPFTTAWMGANHFAALPTAVYGVNLLLAGLSYYVLSRVLVAHHGPDSRLAQALGRDFKGHVSLALYAGAIPLAFVNRWFAQSIYWLVALIWFVPDRRIESRVNDHHAHRPTE